MGGKSDPEEVCRVLSDYRKTLSQLLKECVDCINGWGAGRGSGLRMQAHGASANLLDMYAAATIPETEVFGASHFGHSRLPMRGALVREGPAKRSRHPLRLLRRTRCRALVSAVWRCE